MAGNKPEKMFRIGSITASVFPHMSDNDRTFRSVSVRKRYRDGEEFKYSSSFTLAELPQAARALQLAQAYLESIEADIAQSD